MRPQPRRTRYDDDDDPLFSLQGITPFRMALGAVATAVALAVIFMFIPHIGGTIENELDLPLGADNSFNNSHNADLETGGEFFVEMQAWLPILFIGLMAVLGLFFLMGRRSY